jgi:hypothetical protein
MQSFVLPNALINGEIQYDKTEPTRSPEDLFKLPTLASFVGERGKGKTHAATNLMKYHMENGYFTRIYCISPTYESNEVLHVLPIREEDIYTTYYKAGEAINHIVTKVKQDVSDFKNQFVYKKKYEQFQEAKRKGLAYSDMLKKDRDYMEEMQTKIAKMYMDLQLRMEYMEDKLTPADREMAMKAEFPNILENPDMSVMNNPLMDVQNWPVFMFPYEIVKPAPVLFIDDMSHSDIYSTSRVNPLVNLCLRHRHLGGAGFGVTIYFAVQTFKTGVPKALRNNCQQFYIFQGSDISVLDSMYEEFGGLCSKEQFYELYESAIGEDPASHHFLTVDKNASDYTRVFRRDFHEVLIIPRRSTLRQLISQAEEGEKEKEEKTKESSLLLDTNKYTQVGMKK